MSDEEWREVPGKWPYEVSDQGRVRRSEPGKGTQVGRVLKPYDTHNGYKFVHLCKNGESSPYRVHRLVLRAFVGPCPEGCEADHINRVRDDNRLENLRWLDALKNRGQRADTISRAKLTREEVIEIRVTYETCEGVSQESLAEQYGVSLKAIWRAVWGHTWSDVPGPVQEVPREKDFVLDPADVLEIRRRYAREGGTSYADLARDYGISSSQIGRIVRREDWVELGDPEEPDE